MNDEVCFPGHTTFVPRKLYSPSTLFVYDTFLKMSNSFRECEQRIEEIPMTLELGFLV